jgi:RNA polymerase sigma-70 factor (ECF subfamily)
VAEVEGPGPALVMIDAIAPDLENYHLLHAARGTILRRLGRREDARAVFERAADLAVTEADRRFLVKQLEVLAEDEVQP